MTHANALNPVAWRDFRSAVAMPLSKLGSEVGMWDARTLSVKALYGRVMRQVFVMSFEQLCIVIMLIVAAGLIPLYFIKPKKHTGGPIVDSH